jgi:hypothetical protein
MMVDFEKDRCGRCIDRDIVVDVVIVALIAGFFLGSRGTEQTS